MSRFIDYARRGDQVSNSHQSAHPANGKPQRRPINATHANQLKLEAGSLFVPPTKPANSENGDHTTLTNRRADQNKRNSFDSTYESESTSEGQSRRPPNQSQAPRDRLRGVPHHERLHDLIQGENQRRHHEDRQGYGEGEQDGAMDLDRPQDLEFRDALYQAQDHDPYIQSKSDAEEDMTGYPSQSEELVDGHGSEEHESNVQMDDEDLRADDREFLNSIAHRGLGGKPEGNIAKGHDETGSPIASRNSRKQTQNRNNTAERVEPSRLQSNIPKESRRYSRKRSAQFRQDTNQRLTHSLPLSDEGNTELYQEREQVQLGPRIPDRQLNPYSQPKGHHVRHDQQGFLQNRAHVETHAEPVMSRSPPTQMQADLALRTTNRKMAPQKPDRHTAPPDPDPRLTPRPHKRTQLAKSPGERPAPEINELDHKPEDLYRMSYSALADEPFDTDPSAPALPANCPQPEQTDLSSRLNFYQRMPTSDQGRFFASLSQDECDEAGTWFAERFAEHEKRRGEIRREKREIARRFEEIVGRRYEGVVKEAKDLDEALKGMKRDGGMVLENWTPKRKRDP